MQQGPAYFHDYGALFLFLPFFISTSIFINSCIFLWYKETELSLSKNSLKGDVLTLSLVYPIYFVFCYTAIENPGNG